MSRRNRKSKGNLSVLDGIDSEFEDIEQNFSDNPTVKTIVTKKTKPKKIKGPDKKTSIPGNGTQTEYKPRKTPESMEHKRNTIEAQTVHPTRHNRNTIGVQTAHKPKERDTYGIQTVHPTRHDTEHERSTNGTQTVHSSAYSELVGLQRKMALYFFELCKFSPERNTPKITVDHLKEHTEMTKGSIKTTLARLKQKGILFLVQYKDGRGGWGIYRLADEIFNEILEASDLKRNTNDLQTEHKRYTKGYTEPDTSPSSSNSSNINTITTKNNDLDEIQIPELLKKKGFGLTHLKQMVQRFEFEVGEIQEFLEAYAFDLQGEQGKKLEARGTNLIGYFFGALKNGGYNPVSKDFKTAEDQAMEDQLCALEERKKNREEREARIIELKFEEWLAEKGKDELEGLVPITGEYLGQFHKANLKDYYQREVFNE